MKRFFIYLLCVCIGAVFVWKYPLMRRNVMSFSETSLHRVLEQDYGWLNTSRPLKAEDFKGRILLLDFWTYCCINCLHVIPDLKKLEAEFGEHLTVIGVHSGKFFNERDEDNIRAAVLRHHIEHPVVNDAPFRIWKSFGVRAWPTLVLLNPEGRIDRIYSGEGHLNELRDDIGRLQKAYTGGYNIEPLPLNLEANKKSPSFLKFPGKLAYAPDRKLLFVSDSSHHRILGMTLQGEIQLVIGEKESAGWKEGSFSEARFNGPQGLLYVQNILYVADTENHLLRKINLNTQKVTTIAGLGKQGFEREVEGNDALKTPLSSPWDLELSPDEKEIIIAMAGTHQLWGYHRERAQLRVIAGNGIESMDDGRYPHNSLSQPSGISRLGKKFYFVDSETSSLRVLEDGRITTLIGTGLFDFGFKDGKGKEGQLQHPLGVFADESGVYIADSYNHAIRRYDPATQKVVNITGQGVSGFFDGGWGYALFQEPNDVIKIGDQLFVTDTNNHLIRVIDLQKKTVRTLELSLPQTTSILCTEAECIPRDQS